MARFESLAAITTLNCKVFLSFIDTGVKVQYHAFQSFRQFHYLSYTKLIFHDTFVHIIEEFLSLHSEFEFSSVSVIYVINQCSEQLRIPALQPGRDWSRTVLVQC